MSEQTTDHYVKALDLIAAADELADANLLGRRNHRTESTEQAARSIQALTALAGAHLTVAMLAAQEVDSA